MRNKQPGWELPWEKKKPPPKQKTKAEKEAVARAKRAAKWLLGLSVIMALGCPPAPVGGPRRDVGDAGDVTGCNAMCAHRRALGCEDAGSPCEATCVHVVTSHLTDLKIPCLTAATSKADMVACGTAACP